jgi:hypothetical protein
VSVPVGGGPNAGLGGTVGASLWGTIFDRNTTGIKAWHGNLHTIGGALSDEVLAPWRTRLTAVRRAVGKGPVG